MRNLKVILGSTREGRYGDKVAKTIMSLLQESNEFNASLIDLKEWDLPFYNEKSSMQYSNGEFSSEIINKWTKEIAEADAFIIITPEYNHGYPAVLKNALDYAYFEWKRKPVAFVSYSAGQLGGVRAVEQLRQVVAELHMADIRDGLYISNIFQSFDESGNFMNIDSIKTPFNTVISELAWWTDALKEARLKS